MDMLSKHSSNPLQASSDDPINAKFLVQIRPVLEREKTRGDRDPSSVHRQHEELLAQLQDEEDELMLGGSLEPDSLVEENTEMGSTSSDEGEEQQQPDEEEGEEFDPNDEEYSIYLKEPEEQAQIMAEIKDLESSLDGLATEYKVVDRLGEGTFSSVYKAIDLNHDETYNTPWQGHHPPSSSAHFQSALNPPSSKVFVAIKRIYVTSSPARIQNEIELMEICRGARHVAQLITAFRHRDQVVAIMPYHSSADFRAYYSKMPLSSIQSYLRCLFRALRDVHAREIVHRDVKPANFLFNPATGEGVLVDFGLAQKVDFDVETSCNHTSATKEAVHGKLHRMTQDQVQRFKNMASDQRKKGAGPSDRVGWLSQDPRPQIKANRAGTRGFRAPEVLFKCEDQTAALDIWSVGTILLSILSCRFPIFNANDDIEALMEIAAVIGKRKMEKCAQLHNRTFCTNVPTIDYPGVTWEEMATRLNPSLVNPSEPAPRQTHSSSPLITSSKPSPYASPDPNYSRGADPLLPQAFDLLERMLHHDQTRRITSKDALAHPFLEEKVRMCEEEEADMYVDGGEGNLGDKEPVIESREYEDPFTGEILVAKGDDIYFPHPIGSGVCDRGHWRDEETQAHCVFVVLPPESLPKSAQHDRKRRRRDEILQILTIPADEEVGRHHKGKDDQAEATIRVQVKHLVAGEGIAIGVDPCEFHRDGIVAAKCWKKYGRRDIQEYDDEMGDQFYEEW